MGRPFSYGNDPFALSLSKGRMSLATKAWKRRTVLRQARHERYLRLIRRCKPRELFCVGAVLPAFARRHYPPHRGAGLYC